MSNIRKKLEGKTTKLAHRGKKIEDHPADFNNYQEGAFYTVETQTIKPNPHQPRKHFDETSLKELSQSIKEKGVLQPVLIRIDDKQNVYLVAGERRWRAAKMAGLSKIPAVITKGHPLEIALIENLQRDNLKPIDEAEALAQLLQEHKYTQAQLASVVGKAQPTISETLSLNRLPEEIKSEYRRADIPRRILVEVAKQKTVQKMTALFSQIKDGNLTSDQVREKTRKPSSPSRSPALIALDKTLNLSNHLSKIDFETIADNEKIDLVTALKHLQEALKKLL